MENDTFLNSQDTSYIRYAGVALFLWKYLFVFETRYLEEPFATFFLDSLARLWTMDRCSRRRV